VNKNDPACKNTVKVLFWPAPYSSVMFKMSQNGTKQL
jgi:hypothetical protein